MVGGGGGKKHYLYKLSLSYKRGILDLPSSITGTEVTNASISTDFSQKYVNHFIQVSRIHVLSGF